MLDLKCEVNFGRHVDSLYNGRHHRLTDLIRRRPREIGGARTMMQIGRLICLDVSD